jgi:release factor glutamine methyltransferase
MRIASNKIKDVVRFFRDELQGLYDDAEITTFITYCFDEFAQLKRHEISLKGNDTISESELLKFNFAVKDLKRYRPIQHILSKADFLGMKFFVNEHVLIPRPETEELVMLVLNDIQNKKAVSVLDVGTGSGCISIALKKKCLIATIDAIDISKEALMVSKKNAMSNHVEVNFIEQDILSPVKENISEKKYDVIISNPPYVRNLEKKKMSNNVLDFEPHIALFVEDSEPLIFYNAIAHYAKTNMNKEGRIYLEINEYLGPETAAVFIDKGFKNVELLKDINGKNRILRVSNI